MIVDTQFEKQLSDYRLTTAEITYHMPDYPEMLQLYVWQEYDIAPKYPELKGFLDFWSTNLDGKLHSILLASKTLITPADLEHWDDEFTVH